MHRFVRLFNEILFDGVWSLLAVPGALPAENRNQFHKVTKFIRWVHQDSLCFVLMRGRRCSSVSGPPDGRVRSFFFSPLRPGSGVWFRTDTTPGWWGRRSRLPAG